MYLQYIILMYSPIHCYVCLLLFQILISILLNWLLCGILTSAGVFTNDPKNIEYKARTDARSDVIYTSPWFTFPYPGLLGNAFYNNYTILPLITDWYTRLVLRDELY